MKIKSVVLIPKGAKTDLGNIVHTSTNKVGLFVDIKDGGIIISSRDEDNGWYMVAFHTTDTIATVIPYYK